MEYEVKVTRKFILDENEIRAIRSFVGRTSIKSRVKEGVSEKDSRLLNRLYSEIEKALFYVESSGNVIFKGNLSAATGTFAGELIAATGTFAGELSAATGTFSGNISGASGTFTGNIYADKLYGLVDYSQMQ